MILLGRYRYLMNGIFCVVLFVRNAEMGIHVPEGGYKGIQNTFFFLILGEGSHEEE
jgi:hypothetical protein